ncbi:MAG TPA: DUF3592 domain-containing protein [Pirellulales bacterium]|nr:DUF3592 domain-containing protein [Pirellulales bacterium]
MPLTYKPYKPLAFKKFDYDSHTPKTPPREPSTNGLIFGAMLWSSITLVFDVVMICGAVHQIQALGFAKTAGQVTESRVETEPDSDDGTSYSAKIVYKYRVGGREYVGDRYRFGMNLGDEKNVRRLVAAHPVDRQINVFYSPRDPATSVLKTGIEGIDLFGPMAMMPFNVIMVGLWMLACGTFFRRLLRIPAAGAKIVEDGYSTRVRLAPKSPLFNAGGVVAIVAFIGIFVVGFSCGANPPIPFMLWAWGIIFGAGALAYLLTWIKGTSDKNQLVIDEARGRLTLPATFGRTEAIGMRFKDVSGIEVEARAKSDGEGGASWTFSPTVVFSEPANPTRREKIAEYYTRAKAGELVDWLRERVGLGPTPDANPRQQASATESRLT